MKDRGIKYDSETTSAVSAISYDIENSLFNKVPIDLINKKIIKLQEKKKFPPNLQLVDAFFDSEKGVSGCAFLDSTTGETIVGFAGTNWDNGILEGSKDIFVDAFGVGLGMATPTSGYLQSGQDFIEKLQAQGYTISTTTGHSLGGFIAMAQGLKFDIPLVITYNSAPIHGMALINEYKQLYKNYSGRVIGFVSEQDFLNALSDGVNALYIGEKYILYNDKDHAMNHFMNADEQSYITNVLLMEKGFLEGKTGFVLDFDRDGKPDLALTPEQLKAKNLLGNPSHSGGSGEKVELNAASLEHLGFNLANLSYGDLGWIDAALAACVEKNEQIKGEKENRHDTLCEEIVSELKASSLNQLLGGINDSFGQIEKKTAVLSGLESFDAYAITRKFDEWGGSAGRKWFADGAKWDNTSFIDAVKKVQDSSSVLRHNVETDGTLEQTISGQKQIYTYDTLSKIGEAFVNVTNGLEPKIKKTFEGSGLREGKQDGIPEALAEVFEVEKANVAELKKGVDNLSQMAHAVAQNFKEMDRWLKEAIESGNISVSAQAISVPGSYEAYLEESHIMDDVQDVLEAFDQQVEERSMKLATALTTDYGDLLNRFNEKCSGIIRYIADFETSITDLNSWMGKSITSKRDKITQVPNLMRDGQVDIGRPYKTEISVLTESHGVLSSAFPADVVEYVQDAERDIIPLLEIFHETLAYSETFGTRLYDLQNYLKSVIEHGVYKSMELDCIVVAQNGIGQMLAKMAEELNALNLQLKSEIRGKALQNFASQVDDVVTLIGYVSHVIEDCFGVKVEASKPASTSKR